MTIKKCSDFTSKSGWLGSLYQHTDALGSAPGNVFYTAVVPFSDTKVFGGTSHTIEGAKALCEERLTEAGKGVDRAYIASGAPNDLQARYDELEKDYDQLELDREAEVYAAEDRGREQGYESGHTKGYDVGYSVAESDAELVRDEAWSEFELEIDDLMLEKEELQARIDELEDELEDKIPYEDDPYK